ncbi:ABC transporter substrate-binding protein [Streptosporangium sp. NPDC001559]|uniref:ABC transporter substrate-binding protein n=1 Tax=Streptosporangium sp. NPDC001559 TaxID=3366187 RepID=UPI0036E35CBE
MRRRTLHRITTRIVAGLASLCAMMCATACAPLPGGRTVSVLATWTGTEAEHFGKVLAAFEDRTGIHVEYTGTRAIDETLRSDLRGGTPPDIAILPSTGDLAQYAHSGDLLPLDMVLSRQDQYGQPWLLRLNRKVYAVPFKVNLKSVVWYDRSRWRPTPQETRDPLSLRTRGRARSVWCLGMQALRSAGWPGTDWIEDVLLHQAGPEKYREWASGTLKWTSGEVRQAWETWGRILDASGLDRQGRRVALLTDFSEAGLGLFGDPPGCLLEHQASFVIVTYPAGGDVDFFPFPSLLSKKGGTDRRSVVVSADFAGMFNATPQAQELMRFLAGDEAQRIWPAIPAGAAFSANLGVPPNVHSAKDPVGRKVADTLDGAAMVCLDASDLMPPALRDAFGDAVIEYLSAPERLPDLLTELDRVQDRVGDRWQPNEQEREDLRSFSCPGPLNRPGRPIRPTKPNGVTP